MAGLFLGLGCKKKTETAYIHIQRCWITKIETADSMALGETKDIVVSFVGINRTNTTPHSIEMTQKNEDTFVLKANLQYIEGRACLPYPNYYSLDTLNPVFKLSIPFSANKKGSFVFISNEMNTACRCIIY
ncbi:MAG: hypothetical protein PSX81_12825 [bacterium]|nr:hypothetical protein [bacterium]